MRTESGQNDIRPLAARPKADNWVGYRWDLGRDSATFKLALWLELGSSSGFSDRSTDLSAHGKPLSFADLARFHPGVNRHQTLDHVGTAPTQQFRSVLFALAEVAVHLVAPVLKAAGSPELLPSRSIRIPNAKKAT